MSTNTNTVVPRFGEQEHSAILAYLILIGRLMMKYHDKIKWHVLTNCEQGLYHQISVVETPNESVLVKTVRL